MAVAWIVKAGGLHNHRPVHCGLDDELFPQSSSTGPSCGFDETLSVFFHLMQPDSVCSVSELLGFLDGPH